MSPPVVLVVAAGRWLSCRPQQMRAAWSRQYYGSSPSPKHQRNRAEVSRRRPPSILGAMQVDQQAWRSPLEGPPETFSYVDEVGQDTVDIVSKRYPDLMDLVDEGTLLVIPRSQEYVERRSDGYQEPLEVFVVATAHLSDKSRRDVERVVQAVNPENVVVELCKSRAGVMYESPDPQKSKDNNALSLSGDSFLGAVGRSTRLGGRSALVLRLLLGRISKRMSDKAGVMIGGEMKAARESASAMGAQVVLGDRPIEITLQRAWSSLSGGERWQLCRDLVSAMSSPVPELGVELMESLKEDDVVSAMLKDLGRQYPALLCSLVHERDLYLAWSLKRSKAVNGTSRVVGVIGRGHLRGVVYALRTDPGGLKFKDLTGGKNSKKSQKDFARGAAKRVAWELVLAVAFLALSGKFFIDL